MNGINDLSLYMCHKHIQVIRSNNLGNITNTSDSQAAEQIKQGIFNSHKIILCVVHLKTIACSLL